MLSIHLLTEPCTPNLQSPCPGKRKHLIPVHVNQATNTQYSLSTLKSFITSSPLIFPLQHQTRHDQDSKGHSHGCNWYGNFQILCTIRQRTRRLQLGRYSWQHCWWRDVSCAWCGSYISCSRCRLCRMCGNCCSFRISRSWFSRMHCWCHCCRMRYWCGRCRMICWSIEQTSTTGFKFEMLCIVESNDYHKTVQKQRVRTNQIRLTTMAIRLFDLLKRRVRSSFAHQLHIHRSRPEVKHGE